MRYAYTSLVLTPAFDAKGDIKVLDTFLYTGYPNGYLQMLTNKLYKTNLSPELLQSYMIQKVLPEIDQEKSDVFSIAIVLLSVTFGESFENYYDYAAYKMDFNRLYKRMNRLVKHEYNEDLCDLIVLMLSESPKKRPSFEKILEKIERLDLELEKLCIVTA